MKRTRIIIHTALQLIFGILCIVPSPVQPIDASMLFRSHSADITEAISSDLPHVINRLNAQSLIPKTSVDLVSLTGVTDYNKATRVTSQIQSFIDSSSSPTQYLVDVCHVLLKQENEKIKAIVTTMLKQLGKPVCQGMIGNV